MHMLYGLHAQQRHYERIQHALGPRPESYGQVVLTQSRRSFSVRPRIAQLTRWLLLIPRVNFSRHA
jgi:hypothetical protein